MGVAQKIVKLIIVTKFELNMQKLDRINNVHHLSTNYNHEHTTNSVTVLSNSLTNILINTTCIVKDIKLVI